MNKLQRHSNKSVVSTHSFAFLALIFLLAWVIYPTNLAAQPNLTVTLSGKGRVNSTSPSSPVINCPITCSGEFPPASSVTLSATPELGYVFSSWGGDCSGTLACQLNLDQTKAVSASFTRKDDLILDFDQQGVWHYYRTTGLWDRLDKSNAVQIVSADLEGNGKTDVVINFGPPKGLWALMNNQTWVKLHGLSPINIAASDLDGNGKADLSVSFGKDLGLWAWMNNQLWEKLYDLSPSLSDPVYANDNTLQDLLFGFGSDGLWQWTDNKDWVSVHKLAVIAMSSGDFDGNGQEDIAISFSASSGLWYRLNGKAWVKVHNLSPVNIVAADLDGNNQADLVIDFGKGLGLWLWMNNHDWVKLHNLSPVSLTPAFLDDNSQQDLVLDFGPNGIWQWMNNRSWIRLHPLTARHIVASPVLNRPPQITSTPVTTGTEGQAYSYQVTATDPENDSLIFSLTTAPNGMVIHPSSGLLEWAQPTVGGPFSVAVTVTDGNGGTGTQAFAVQVTAIASNETLVPQVTGLARSEGESLIQQNKLNLGTASFQHSDSVADGRVIQQTPAANAKVSIGTAVDYIVSLGPDTGLPPNPATVAPPVDQTVATTVSASTEFLYSGPNAIQTGVAPGTIEARRAAVIRGRVLADGNLALPGVIVSILNHPELGQTKTRSDGAYDLAVNGGGQLTMVFNKDGYLPTQRNVLNVPWQGYAVVEDAVLIAKDSKVTTLNLNSPEPMKVAQGSVVIDSDGQRQATLMIPQGVTAQVYNPDGTTRTVSQLNFRATEYTVGPDGPKKMPGPLPPTSGYTYAVELSADEATTKIAGKDVLFSQPVPFYVDNFLNMPVGIQVPVAYWDKTKNAWIPSDDGKVIKILSITNGLADIDADGDGAADDATKLSSLKITDAERAKLAAYPGGKTLWRALLAHLSTYDLNYPASPPPGATPPNQPPPKTENKDKPDKPSCSRGSIIECQSQTMGETLPIAGTGLSLNYRSDRMLGNRDAYSMTIPLSTSFGTAIPKRIELEVTVAGKTFKQSFPANPNQTYTYQWDGLDAWGRPVFGQQTARVTTTYVYDGYYNLPPLMARSFGVASGQWIPAKIIGRDRAVRLTQTSEAAFLGMPPSFSKLGGWQLSAQHHYDPIGKMLYMGDGQRRSVNGVASNVITTVAGNGQTSPYGSPVEGDGGPATQAKLGSATDVAVGADGSVYLTDETHSTILRVAPDGIINTVAGVGYPTSSYGDGGPATQAGMDFPAGISVSANGSFYFTDSFNSRIRRVGPDGIITTMAGYGGHANFGFSGDGGPATQARFFAPTDVAVGADGSLYIADKHNSRVRRVGSDGIISTVAGNGGVGDSGDGGPATQANFYSPSSVAVGADGSLYFVDETGNKVRRVRPDGIITTVAGNGTKGYSGDGGPATQAALNYPQGVAVGANGNLYISDWQNYRIRLVTPDGIITTVAGNGKSGYSGDGEPATQAMLLYPRGLAVGADGSLYVTDYVRIRRVSPTLPGYNVDEIIIPSEDGAEIYRFDSAGKHLSTRNALTGATLLTFGYDSQGRLIKVTDANGNITAIERNALGEPTAIIAPFGQRTELSLDESGYLASATNPAGEAYAMTYTADGLMTAFKDPRGNASTFTYDELGRLTKDQNAVGGFQTLARQTLASGYEVTRSTSENLNFNYKLENLSTGNRLMTNTAPDGTQTTQLEQTDGTTKTTLPDGTVNTVVQGPDPRFGMQAPIVTSQTMTTGGLSLTQTASRTQTLSDPSNPLSTTSLTDTVTVNSRTTTRVYTVANKTETTTSAAGRISTRTLDALGRVTGTQVTGIAAVSNSYDAQGRLAKISQGTGADERLINLAYNPQGYLASIADAYGRTGSFTYDLAGRVSKQTLPDGNTIDFTYDKNGNLASLTPPGQPPHLFSYDAVDQQQEYAPPDVAAGLNSTRYQYNTDKQLTKITRPDTLTVNFAYDSAGRLSQLTTPDGATTHSYNASTGKLVKTTTPDNIALFFTYNGALLTQTGWNLVGGASPTFTVGYGYDNDFRVNSLKVNGANLVSLQYDADSLLTKVGDLTLSRSAQNGLLTGTALGKQTDSLSYNGFGEMTQYAASYDGTGQFKTVFTRDKLGRITQKQETLAGVTDVYDYTYDTAGRLAEVRKNNGLQAKYTYDANGNRLKYEGAFVAEGTYDAQDRLLTYGGASYSYTANGELKTKTILPSPTGGGVGGEGSITTYAYDVLGNLRHVELSNGNTLDYVIDGQNRRIGKKVNGVLKQAFLWQDQLKPIAELDGSGNLVARFVYATGVNVPDYMVKGGVTYRLVKDHLGSPRLVVRASDGFVIQRMDYDEFGNVLMDTNPGFQPFGFAGGLYDRDTGLVRFGARDYDAITGRWTAKDPILFNGGQTGLFSYVANDPINWVDRKGKDVWIEGPNSNEVPLHESVNVGDPNGDYYSSSNGLNLSTLMGEVYEDTDHGGEIKQYKKTTPEQDALMIEMLKRERGSKSIYPIDDNCISYSRRKFNEAPGTVVPVPKRTREPFYKLNRSLLATRLIISTTLSTWTSQ